MLECVVNISEGRDETVINALSRVARAALLDVHSDAHHNRSVFTLLGTEVVRDLAAEALRLIDLRNHRGVHPRIGVVDVVPFVALGNTNPQEALAARNQYAQWSAHHLGVPTFLYGPERTLPEIRKNAFHDLVPDFGATKPHPSAGATAVGARGVLVAYNLWLKTNDLTLAKHIAAAVRGPAIRTLGLAVGDAVQVSMNLINPLVVGPREAYALVREHAEIDRAELVGLVPSDVLQATPQELWRQLDLDDGRTIEARLEALE